LKEVGFGVRLPIGGSIPSVEGVRRVAIESERLGLNSLYARDNLTWSAEQQLMHISEGARDDMPEKGYIPVHYEPIVTFSYLAGITQKIRLITAILCLDFRPPTVWAKQLSTLDSISNGRLGIGISPGGWPLAYEAFGVPYNERGAILDETVHAMIELWTKDSASFDGKYIRFKNVVQYPKPVQKPHPPILFGAHVNYGAPIIRRIVEYCDGWLPSTSTTQQIAEGKAKIEKRAKKAGKADKFYSVHLQIAVCLAKTDEEAWKKASKTLLADHRNVEKDREKMSETTIVGSPDTWVKRVEAYSEAGVTDFECLFIYRSIDDLVDQMKMLMDEVAPSLSIRPQGQQAR
jgi:probable F420-dependent oxidoreductase